MKITGTATRTTDAAVPPSLTSPVRVTAKRRVRSIGFSTRAAVTGSMRCSMRRLRSRSLSAARSRSPTS